MQTKVVLVFALIGFCCVVDAQFPRFDWKKLMSTDVSTVIDAVTKLQTDARKMNADKKFDGVLLKQDIQGIVKAAEDNNIPIPAETRTKVDELLALIDKMMTDNKYDPAAITKASFAILRSFGSAFKPPTTIKP